MVYGNPIDLNPSPSSLATYAPPLNLISLPVKKHMPHLLISSQPSTIISARPPLCGLVSLSSKYSLAHIPLSETDHALLACVDFASAECEPSFILVLYAPALGPTARHRFFTEILAKSPLTVWTIPLIVTLMQPILITNLFRTTAHLCSPPEWRALLDEHFLDCTAPLASVPSPTWRRGAYISSTIDCIYTSRHLTSTIIHSATDFLHRAWSDHTLLTATLVLGPGATRRGLWRASHRIIADLDFRHSLAVRLSTSFARLEPSLSTDDEREKLKSFLIKFVKGYSRGRTSHQLESLQGLQRRQNRLLQDCHDPSVLALTLPALETAIGTIQREYVTISALRAGIFWREKGS